jgi:hypothetical protein
VIPKSERETRKPKPRRVPSREYPATSAARTAAIRRAVAIGRAAAQHALDSRQEVAWLIGFGDVIVGAGPLTLHQADQARADFAAKRISLICDAHVIPSPEIQQR